MSIRDRLSRAFAIIIAFVFLFVAVEYSFMAISVNSGRIQNFGNLDDVIRQQAAEIAKDPSPANRQALADLVGQRASLRGQIEYGKKEDQWLSFSQCLLPLDPACFHRNSSESNNLLLAMASGALGACLSLLVGFRARAISGNPTPQTKGELTSVICLIPTGMALALVTLYLLRGTKGAFLTPIADVVQVENPYGIAFACTMAAFFSDRILAWLSRMVDSISPRKAEVQDDDRGQPVVHDAV